MGAALKTKLMSPYGISSNQQAAYFGAGLRCWANTRFCPHYAIRIWMRFMQNI